MEEQLQELLETANACALQDTLVLIVKTDNLVQLDLVDKLVKMKVLLLEWLEVACANAKQVILEIIAKFQLLVLLEQTGFPVGMVVL
jgi:hypothetical protein